MSLSLSGPFLYLPSLIHQAQTQHDGLLDDCGEYRSSMGQAAALISLGVAYDMLWEKLPQEV